MDCVGKVNPIMVLHCKVILGIKYTEMDGASGIHKEAIEEEPKSCILFFGQQRSPKMVAKS